MAETTGGDAGERGGRPVVVGIDGSEPSRAALVWASAQARRTGVPLVVLVAWHYPVAVGWGGPPPVPEGYDPQADAGVMAQEMVEQALGDHAGLSVDIEVAEGHPAPILTERSKTASAVVVGSRGHGAFTGMLLGSVSEYVAAHAHCPVVVVRDG